MIITMKNTETREISAKIDELHEERGEAALGRVLTLLISTNETSLEHDLAVANNASREHPCRVLVVAPTEGEDGLDAEIRIGGDAGASEVIVLRPRGGARDELDSLVMPLLLPDAPIVTWWPGTPPVSPSQDSLGAMAQRRITDAMQCSDPVASLLRLGEHHAPGDTDLAWARATLWRGLIAAALDEPPFTPVNGVTIAGNTEHPSVSLLGAWLHDGLGVQVTFEAVPDATALVRVVLHRENGDVVMDRPPNSTILNISEPSGIHHRVSLPLRTLADSLIEDLRRLDPDEAYAHVITKALPALLASKSA